VKDSADNMKKKANKVSSKPEDMKDNMAEKQNESETESKDIHRSM